MIAGSIEIQLMANLARLQRDMDQARGMVSNASAHIERAANAARDALGALGAGVAVGAFAAWVKGAIDASDALNDMSIRTKIAVEDLGGLALAAKLSDASLDDTAASISKLALNMGKDAEKFRALGITATEPLEAFKQLADIFKGIQDPQQRAAFGAEALGKSWQGAALLLEEGSEGIAKLVARGQELSGVTAASAADAAAFNDKLDELAFAAQSVGMRVAADLLPMLNLLTDDLTGAGDSATAAQGSFSPLTETFRALVLLGGTVGFTFKAVGTEIGALTAQAVQFQTAVFRFFTFDIQGARDAFVNGLQIGDDVTADAKKARDAFDEWEKGWLTVGTAAKTVRQEIEEPFPDPYGIDAKLAAEKAAAVAAFLKSGEIDAARKKAAAETAAATKKEGDAYLGLIGPLREKAAANEYEIRTGQAMTETQKAIIKLDEDLKSGKLALTPVHAAEVRALMESVGAQDKWLAAAQQMNIAMQALQADRDSAYSAAVDEATANEELARTFGMTKVQIEALTIARLEDRLAQRQALDLSEEDVRQTERMLAAKKRNAAALGNLDLLGAGTDVTKAKELLDILTAVDDAARQAAAGMEESFGRVGKAIGGLTTALTGYSRAQAAIAAQLDAATKDAGGDTTKIAKANAVAAQQGAQAQMKSYGDMASAAKGFFKENTTGYKVMEGTEKAFRAAEMAMAVESMLEKSGLLTAFTGLFVASKATEVAAETATTGASVGLAGTQASAWGITAVVKALASLPFPANLAAGAATLAAVVAIGAKMVGGIGGGGGDTTAKDRQAAAGTGSVLGDSKAKSDSIARALELVASNSDIELSYTQGMLAALRSIESSLSGLGNLLIRNSGLTGELAAGSKGSAAETAAKLSTGLPAAVLFGPAVGLLATAVDKLTGGLVSKVVGSVANAIFGGKITMLDTGLTADRTSLGGVLSNGIAANQYTDTKKDGGLFHSDKNSTTTVGLGAEANDQIAKVIAGLARSVTEAGKLLGLGGDEFTARLNSFVIDIGKISTKGLTGEEIQKQLETVFSKLGDDMAQFAVGGLAQFQQVGEGYFETLTRVATNYANLDSILAASGTTFGQTGMASIAARERLIGLVGGIDELASKSTSFNDNFLTEAQRLAPVQKYVTDQLAAMGLASIDTRDKFRDTVLGLANSGALATEAGAAQYAGLLALADAFAKTHAATVDLTMSEQAIADQRKDLQDQYDELTMTAAQLQQKAGSQIDVSNKLLWDSIQAELARNAAAEEASAILALQAQMYEANGDKAGAAAVLLAQHQAALIGLSPALAAATQATWAAQAAAKAQQDALDKLKAAAATLVTSAEAAVTALGKAIDREKAAKKAAHDTEIKAIEGRIDFFKDAVAKSKSLSGELHSALEKLTVVPGQEAQDRAVALAQVQAALAIAKAGGPLPELDGLKGALAVLTKDSSDQFATFEEFQRDAYRTANSVKDLSRLTDAQLSVEEKMLASLVSQKDAVQLAYEAEVARLDGILETAKSQLDVAKGISTTMLTIPGALAAIEAAIKAIALNPISAAPAASAGAYQQYLGRDASAAEIDYWKGEAGKGVDIVGAIKGSDEAKIQDLYKSLLGRAGEAAGVDAWERALAAGQSLDQIKAGFMASDEYKKLHGIPGFASGGDFGGGLRLVGEEGPEIEATGPSRIFNARQTASMLGGDNMELVAEVRELRRENGELRKVMESHLYSIAKSSLDTRDFLDGAVNGEVPLAVKETA